MATKIKLLIVDDSRIFRSIIENCLSDQLNIEIIGSTYCGEKTLEIIKDKKPDVVTLDQEMPGLNGLDTLKQIQQYNSENPNQKPVKVIMVSGHTKKGAQITLDSLEAGAFDFITKPDETNSTRSTEKLKTLLVQKINSSIHKNQSPATEFVPTKTNETQTITSNKKHTYEAIIIGVSTGGPKALIEMLPELCKITNVPIFIVQHMPPNFTESLAINLNNRCIAQVQEAKDNEEIKSDNIYIAPGGRHMIIRKNHNSITTHIIDTPAENGCRPSADVLFRSAVSVYQEKVIAIIMTGMGNDGSKSLAALKRAGAYIIAQDQESSVVWGMPGCAVATGHVDSVLPLNQMAQFISKL